MYSFIFGTRTIESIIKYQSARVIRFIFIHYQEKPNNLHIPYEIWSKQLFKKVFGQESISQGVCLITKQFPYSQLNLLNMKEISLCTILDGLENPGNLGRATRSSVALGSQLIIITKKKSSPITPMAEKIATGHFSRIPIVQTTNLNKTLSFLKRCNFHIIGSCSKKTHATIYNFKFPPKTAIVIGNELHGIHKNTKSQCHSLIRIPTIYQLPLNAADALFVFLYEISKQKQLSLS